LKQMGLFTFVVMILGAVWWCVQTRPYKITGYCSCKICCLKDNGVTTSGTKAHKGTVASSRLSFGTVVDLRGLGRFTVEDRGSLEPRQIDVWYPTHTEARKAGVTYRTVRIVRMGK
jgi:3D (Asp-Asp-Asp) domain-containing protein